MEETSEDFQEVESPDSRTVRLLGEKTVERLRGSRVFVAGCGGVGGYVIEMLARTGIGHLTIVDADDVAPSNINRQIIALRSTVGQRKTTLFCERIRDIDPLIEVEALDMFITPENVPALLEAGNYDFVVDAIDTVAPKVALLSECLRRKIPVVSSMGAGGRTDASKVIVTDLWQTRDDGLARAVRQRLKKAGLRGKLPVVASTELPSSASLIQLNLANKRTSLGTIATVPSTFGILMASYVINSLIKC